MRKAYFFIIAFLAFANISTAAPYVWNGVNGTDYQDAANWTPIRTVFNGADILQFNATSPIIVTNVRNETIGAIQILTGTSSVTFSANAGTNVLTLSAAIPLIYSTAGSILSADNLTIQLSNGSAFTISSGTFGIAPSTGGKIAINGPLALSASGTLDFDVVGTGGTTINAAGSITYNSGNFSCVTASSITWANGSNYYHNVDGVAASAIPAATWQTGSTCNITGMSSGTVAPSGFTGIDFANFTWNCSAQVNTIDLLPALSLVNINGTFTITNTNSKELRLSSVGTVTVKTGNYVQNGGIITLQATPGTAETTTLAISGSFTHSGGTLNGVGGTSPGSGIIDFKGNVTRGAAATWQTNSSSNLSQFILQFSGSSTQTVDLSSGSFVFPSQSRCNIVNNNTDIVNGISLTGALRVVNGNSSQPATLTMNGKISGGGVVTYSGSGSGGTTLIYSGNNFQTATGIEFPVSAGLTNLTINNPLGLTFPASFPRTVPGTLSMLSGNLEIGLNTLTLSNANLGNQLNYTGGFITSGTLARTFPTTGLPTDTSNTSSLFPFGTGNNNRWFRIYFSSAVLSGGTPGIISVTHNSLVGVVTGLSIPDNGITLDKRTVTDWTTSMGTFSLGGGGETILLSVIAGNIGAVDDFTKLRLTDGATGYGTLIANSGSNSVPVTGKSGLTMADMNKPLYIGSDGTTVYNPLIIITFNWTGNGGNTAWTNPANWSVIGASGYPSASTEIAIINSKVVGGTEPTINSSDNISVYQLTVSGGLTLTMVGNAVINVYDIVNFSGGSASFATTSTFGYASPAAIQNLISLPYGNLAVSGNGSKNLPATITVTGNYSLSGSTPLFTSNTFTYAGAGAQRITAANYDNLTITGNRGGGLITLGNGTSNNIIDIKSVFDVSTLSNFTSKVDFNTVNFSSAGPQTIPGFYYQKITNANGDRTFDNLGSTNPANVITCYSISRGTGVYTITNSKIKFYSLGLNAGPYTGNTYYDLEISGNFGGYPLDFFNSASLSIAGKFSITATNFKLATSGNIYRINFNGTGDQTIPAFKFIDANTPAFKYSNIFVAGGSRDVTLGGGGTDTIAIRGKLTQEVKADGSPLLFTSGYGFINTGSTIDFSTSSNDIPLLKPKVSGGSNYNNIVVSSGSRTIGGNNMIIGGNVTVTGTDAAPATLTVGDGNNARVLTVQGNMAVNGTGSGVAFQAPGQIDLNTGTNGSTKVNLAGNLTISGYGQLMGTTSDNAKNGQIVFNGSATQTYTNTDLTYKNGLVNFTVGDGTNPSNLALASSMNLLTSTVTSPNKDTLTVANNSSLDCGTFNINSNGTGNAVFSLNAGATLITANTGGIEGAATTGTDGSIMNDATIVKVYDPLASYVFNASSGTNTAFPVATTPFPMANLTVGNDVNTATFSLNKSIDVSNALTLKSAATLALGNSNYLNLKSTATSTARIAPVPDNADITYGTGRFVIERYYPARRAWRLITAPITADANRSVFNSWQLGGATTFLPCGTGTFVTGPGANPATNGLDVSVQSNSSLKLYNGTSFINLANSKTQLLSGTAGIAGTPDNIGMFLFVRGDRSTQQDLFNVANSNTTTLRDTGMVQIKSQTFQLNLPVNGFELVGNPYASPVDFNLIDKTNNVYPHRFYVWDPTINQVGAYVTMEDLATPGIFKPTAPYGASSQNNYVQSSQAFFVQKTSSAPGTMVFAETNKSSQNNLGIFREASQPALFSSNLYLKEADTTILADGNLVVFDNAYSAAVDIDDALKFGNTNESLGLLRDAKTLAVERRPAISVNDTLFLKLTKTTQRNYQFQFVPNNMDPSLTGYLEDSYTGAKTIISLASASTFNFTINGDAASSASDRFKIVFKPSAAAAPLPVTYKSIKAYQQSKDIAVEWTVENEINISKYEVEKSKDGINFSRINSVTATGTSNGSTTYNILDKNAVQGNNFYRILSYNQTGAFEYSRVVVVKIGKTAGGISVYPNPVTGNTIGLTLNNIETGIYHVRLTNYLGQTLMTKKLNYAAGNSMETLTPDSKMSTGIYNLEITSPDKQIRIIKVIVQ